MRQQLGLLKRRRNPSCRAPVEKVLSRPQGSQTRPIRLLPVERNKSECWEYLREKPRKKMKEKQGKSVQTQPLLKGLAWTARRWRLSYQEKGNKESHPRLFLGALLFFSPRLISNRVWHEFYMRMAARCGLQWAVVGPAAA